MDGALSDQVAYNLYEWLCMRMQDAGCGVMPDWNDAGRDMQFKCQSFARAIVDLVDEKRGDNGL